MEVSKGFAQWGFDVNDPQYGKWVEAELHSQWSNSTNGWNDEWKAFLTNELAGVSDLEQGRQMIFDKLQEMRGKYGPYPPTESKPFAWFFSD